MRATDIISKFFEGLLHIWDSAPLDKPYSRWDDDVIHFVGHEIFVGFVGISMQERAFETVSDVLSMPMFKPSRNEVTGESVSYCAFREPVSSLDNRNGRLGLRRISLHADLIKDSHINSVLSFSQFLEADLTLYIRGLIDEERYWYPTSAVYLGRSYGGLPTYERATSARFYERLKPLLLGVDVATLRNVVAQSQSRRRLSFDYSHVDVERLINLDKLGNLP